MNFKRKTIINTCEFSGLGIHSGLKTEIKLTPNNGEGIVFYKNSIAKKADFLRVDASRRSSDLIFKEFKVKTIEHLFAALWITGLSDVNIEINGDEIPFLDGSCHKFCKDIKESGLKELNCNYELSNINYPVIAKDSQCEILFIPKKELSLVLTVILDYEVEKFTEIYSVDLYDREQLYSISKARTFAFESWIEDLRKKGLIKGGSLDNALVINSEGKAINKEGFRFSKECAKHKVIDFVGDLMLYPKVLTGRIVVFYPGHRINNLFLRELNKTDKIKESVDKTIE